MTIHPDISRLASMLGEMADLCAKHHSGWAEGLSKWQRALLASDAWGLHQLLQALGGMGSLNDVVLQRIEADMQPDNERFHLLLGEAYDLAHHLKRTASNV